MDCSPTSLTGTDAMLTEMPLEEEEEPASQEKAQSTARRELRANKREKAAMKSPAKSPASLKTMPALLQQGLTSDFIRPMGSFAALEVRNRRRQLQAAHQEAALSSMLVGEWEITAQMTDDNGKRASIVWGKAVISALTDAALVKSKPERRMACSFEGSIDTSVIVRWHKHYATLDLEASSWPQGKIKWRLQPLPNGKLGGYTTWRRKQVPIEPSVPGVYSVVEVATDEQRRQVWELHTRKAAFANEHEHIKARVFRSEEGAIHCRSWLLTATDMGKTNFLGAVTVRINPYIKKDKIAWAQIMNLSVLHERRGYGTRLMAGVEELLWRERVDVCALYPVPNSRADSFWTSLGYALWPDSLLPQEELDSRSGALLPEGFIEKGVKTVLPRWEKKLLREHLHPMLCEGARKRKGICLEDGSEHAIDTYDEVSWKALKRSNWPLWRKISAADCKLDAEELEKRLAVVQEEKERRRSQSHARAHSAESRYK